jgi:hypothetical protein
MLASRGFLRSAVAALRTQAPLRFFGAAPSGGIPSNLEHSVGLERAEAEAAAQGKDLFEPQLVGPFGTKEHPVIVESIHHERIVGCPGHCNDGDTSNNNEIRWFKVTSKAPFVCADCGQVCTSLFISYNIHNSPFFSFAIFAQRCCLLPFCNIVFILSEGLSFCLLLSPGFRPEAHQASGLSRLWSALVKMGGRQSHLRLVCCAPHSSQHSAYCVLGAPHACAVVGLALGRLRFGSQIPVPFQCSYGVDI